MLLGEDVLLVGFRSSDNGTMADGDRGGGIGDDLVVLSQSSEGVVELVPSRGVGMVRGGKVMIDAVGEMPEDGSGGEGDDRVIKV